MHLSSVKSLKFWFSLLPYKKNRQDAIMRLMKLDAIIKNSRTRFFLHNILLFIFLSFSGIVIQQGLLTILLIIGISLESILISFLKLTPFWNENFYWMLFEFVHIIIPVGLPKFFLFCVSLLLIYAVIKQDISPQKNKRLYFLSSLLTLIGLFLTLVSLPFKESARVGTYVLFVISSLGIFLIPSVILLRFRSADEIVISPKISRKLLLLGLVIVLVFFMILPRFFTKAEIIQQQSQPISKKNQWVIAHKGDKNSATLGFTVFNNFLYTLTQYPNKLSSYDGRNWKEVRRFDSIRVIGLTSSNKELLIFGKGDGYDNNSYLFRYNGSSWLDLSYPAPVAGWNPRFTWWNNQLYLIGQDFSLYRLGNEGWVMVSKLPDDAVVEVRKNQDVRGTNLISYNGQLYVVIGNRIYTYSTDWKKLESNGKLFETNVIESWNSKLVFAGCCYPNQFSILNGIQINSLESKIYDQIYDVVAFSNILYIAAGRDGIWKFNGEKLEKDISYSEAYGSEETKYYLDPQEFGSVNSMAVYRNKLYVGGKLSPYVYMHETFN